MGFLVDNNPAAYINIGKIAIVYNSKYCSGLPSDTIPSSYLSTFSISASSGALTYTIKSTCLAYYDVASPSDATNKSTLDQLTQQFAQDYISWKKVTFDYMFAGIINPVMSGLYDVVEFDYLSERDLCRTRAYSYPLNWTVQNLGHFDYKNDCVNSIDTGDLNWDAQPFRALYGPPGMCSTAASAASGGGLQLTRWGIIFTDGRLQQKYLSTDLID
jgi:hypothetical protein